MQDNLKVLSPNKNVDEICHTKSNICENNIVEDHELKNTNEVQHYKRPYLKRGTGLARYGLNINEIKKKTGKLKFHKAIRTIPPKIKVPRKCLNQVQMLSKTECGSLNLVLLF